jgi:hypothetical protein
MSGKCSTILIYISRFEKRTSATELEKGKKNIMEVEGGCHTKQEVHGQQPSRA